MNPEASFGNIFRELAEWYYTLIMQDNSICKFQCAAFLKLGSHYPPLIAGLFPIAFSYWIVRPTNVSALRF